MEDLSKGEKTELEVMGQYQPVFAGDVLSKEDSRSLISKGLALKYEGDYCLTEKGKKVFKELFPGKVLGCKTSRSHTS